MTIFQRLVLAALSELLSRVGSKELSGILLAIATGGHNEQQKDGLFREWQRGR